MVIDNSWFEKAACKGMEPKKFFPNREENEKYVIKICCQCPVKQECLEYALEHRIEYGIWGGKGARARNRIRRQRRKANVTRRSNC